VLVAVFVMDTLTVSKDFWLCSKAGTRCSWLLVPADPLSWLSLLRFAGWVVALWLFVPVLPLNFSDFVVAGID
jgi:hypothetical protein